MARVPAFGEVPACFPIVRILHFLKDCSLDSPLLYRICFSVFSLIFLAVTQFLADSSILSLHEVNKIGKELETELRKSASRSEGGKSNLLKAVGRKRAQGIVGIIKRSFGKVHIDSFETNRNFKYRIHQSSYRCRQCDCDHFVT